MINANPLDFPSSLASSLIWATSPHFSNIDLTSLSTALKEMSLTTTSNDPYLFDSGVFYCGLLFVSGPLMVLNPV